MHHRVWVHRERHYLPVLEHLEVVFLHLVISEDKLLVRLLDLQHVDVLVLYIVQVNRLFFLRYVHDI